jgi:DNA-binding NarL/FixJ family response regulator
MSGPTRRVLIADDHEVVRNGIRLLFETRPNLVIVAEANNGREALRQARATKPDIAIIDYSLPELNGLDLTISLKHELPRVQVLIYTMHDRETLLFEMLRAGARGYVLKSEPGQNLLAAVEALSVNHPYFSGVLSEELINRYVDSPSATKTVLAPREREIVALIAEGHMNREISQMLDISIKTVETHRSEAMRKLKLHSTADLVRYAVRNHLVQD